ncbi:hypothetical protein DSO57_1025723 [Entomophthora muscae]|uniref:Uncharacterized protein n=1 Tax=Entomophthora muscae TaxID=34485 RepID=A0ACC2UNJ7_9FUNG|nr:hypothetical protein DSO57_1025723 [Entomophthora muscae]
MNDSLNIIDNNLLLFKEAELFAPSSAFESSKGNGLVSSICSLLTSVLSLEMASEPLFSATIFELGSSFGSVETDLFKMNVNLTLNQSLPFNQLSSQSMLDNNNSNHLGFTPSDVGNNGEAGSLLCLVLGPLVAVPSVVRAKSTSWPPPSVELSTYQPSHARK